MDDPYPYFFGLGDGKLGKPDLMRVDEEFSFIRLSGSAQETDEGALSRAIAAKQRGDCITSYRESDGIDRNRRSIRFSKIFSNNEGLHREEPKRQGRSER